MPRPAAVGLALFALALSACDLGGPDAVGITGRWEGTVTNVQDASQQYPITLRLTDTGQTVFGTGEVVLPDDLFMFSIAGGSFIQGDVLLPLQFERPPFQGTISGELTQTDPAEITGTISGSGLANGPLVIELRAR